jgi:hypothetical protein
MVATPVSSPAPARRRAHWLAGLALALLVLGALGTWETGILYDRDFRA